MSAIERLTEKFRDLPSIGPRQAKRFVYFLLTRNLDYLEEMSRLILEIKKESKICRNCFRFFNSKENFVCPICADPNRDPSILAIVEKDVDLENLEKSGVYNGLYFVLGGGIQILEKNPERKVRLAEAASYAEKLSANGGLKEIILAFSLNTEGENTVYVVKNFLKSLTEKAGLKISTLGRGLSTGSELEYADRETLKSAMMNRFSSC